MEEVIEIKIRDLNPHIVCSLCAGYFIDATTITECLHTFCKSCVVKFLHTSKCCPQCGQKVHETQPLQNLKADRVLQDIIFKIVPGLYKSERKRIDDFNGPGSKEGLGETMVSSNCVDLTPCYHGFENDQMICFCLENYNVMKGSKENGMECKLKSKFIQCSERTNAINIKDFLRKYLNLGSSVVKILYESGTPVDDWINLRKLWLMRNPHNSVEPLKLFYQVLKDENP